MFFKVTDACKNWPLADQNVARKQAIKLFRAKQYLDKRGINAYEAGSNFQYRSGPSVLGAN